LQGALFCDRQQYKSMERKVRENLLYALEEDWKRLKKPVLLVLVLVVILIGFTSVFRQIDETFSAVEIEGYSPEPEDATVIVGKEAKLSIPKIGVEVPISFVESTDPADYIAPLKKGVTHYPSSLPGQRGTAVILGHSAPAGIFKKEFNGVFSDLKDLVPGDEILLQYEGQIYEYVVQKQELLYKGEDVPEDSLLSTESKLALLSCWPPGIDNKRIMITAVKI